MEAREVALLLTDVEASTRLLVRHGQSGVVALGRVGAVVSAAASEHGGEVSRAQGEGDSAVVLFTSVGAAVAAALDVNERLAAEHWPAGDRVVVRSAVHVGEVTATDEGLFGLEVHRCARLRSLADGGEVLLSDAAARQVAPQLPQRASVRDEGIVLLRGFAQSERVWRLVHPALAPPRRPLAGASDLAGALPEWRTSLVGRSAEIAAIVDRLGAAHIVTLVGPAGVGKTRLAVAAASQAASRVRFVDLTLATSGDGVPAVAAGALGVEESTSFLAGIEAALSAAPALVVLDNCEHVLDAAAALVDHVSARCAASSILATSRAPLRVPGEEVVGVTPLGTEHGGAAMQLFLDRGQAVGRDLMADGTGLEDVTAIVGLLEGVPLAIELAAARLNAFSVGELFDVLQLDLGGLSDPRRRGPDRQRTLRAAVQWSMRLLSGNEQAVLRRLAVLPGSFRLTTALAISPGAAGALPSLVDHSLAAIEHRTGPTRYRLLETVRAVAEEALAEDERREVLDRLLVCCVDELAVIDGDALPPAGLDAEIRQDHALHVVAAEHALATAQTELGLRLVHGLFAAWHGVGQRSALDRWMDQLVAQTGGPSRVRGMVLRRQGIIAREQLSDYERAVRLLERAEADAVAVSDQHLLGRVRCTRAELDLDEGQIEGLELRLWDAIALLEEAGGEDVSFVLASLASFHADRARVRHGGTGARASSRCQPPLVPGRADRSHWRVVRVAGRSDRRGRRPRRHNARPRRTDR